MTTATLAASTSSALINGYGTLKLSTTALPTCNSSTQWQTRAVSGTGTATGIAGQLCYCRSGGASDYAWVNLFTGTVGSASACAI
jgi:hypothetical protein